MGDEEKKGDISEFDETVMQSEAEMGGKARTKQEPYLVVIEGPRQGMKFPLKEGDNAIGRAMGVEILLEDQSVSRHHAVVTYSREGWSVEDSGSKNGTFVNDQKISEKVTIGHSDVVQVGIYTLRLITRALTKEEALKTLPPDWEGKTVMGINAEEDTSTMAGKLEEGGEVSKEKPEEEKPSAEAEEAEEAEEEKPSEEEMPIPEEITESRKKKRSFWWNLIMIVVLLAVIGGGGAYAYFKFFYKPPKVVKPVKPKEKKPVLKPGEVKPGEVKPGEAKPGEAKPGEVKPVIEKEKLPAAIPVFLDFASSPLPAKVTFQDKDYGTTPVKVQVKLDVKKQYTAKAVFDLKEIGETYKEDVAFTVDRDEPLIPILFKGPIGVLKVMEIPRDCELYLEGYFVYDPFNAKTAKLANIVFGKPVYIPFGKYIVELRKGKELAGSGKYTKDIRYKREILVSEDSPVYLLKVTEKDLQEFPVEIISIPTNADVFMDAKKVGKTPYKGIFPLGEHTLSLRKDGYFDHKQELKLEENVPVKLEISMKTTKAGEFINAGKHLMQNGRYQDAISKLTEVFKKKPTPGEIAQSRYLIGSCFVHLGDLATAEGYFKQAVEDDEMKHPSMLGLVSVYHGLGRKEDAIPNLVEVLLNTKDDEIKKEAYALFSQVSPLRSIIYIHTDPEGARVIVNDKPVEQLTPLILPDRALGNYKIRIEKDGYLPQDLSINLAINEFNPIAVKLKPIPK